MVSKVLRWINTAILYCSLPTSPSVDYITQEFITTTLVATYINTSYRHVI